MAGAAGFDQAWLGSLAHQGLLGGGEVLIFD
jgi:hypothetical protein